MKLRMEKTYVKTYPLQSPLGRIISAVFLIAGLVCCILSITQFKKYDEIKDELVQVEAVIERIEVDRRGDDTDHDVYIAYSYRGERYDNVRLNRYSSSMDEGDRLPITIHPDHPGKPVSNNGPLVLFIGCVFTLVGGGLSVAAWWDRLKPRPAEE